MQILRNLRKAKGLTMKELGDVVGVAESTISQYETGKRSPDFETLLKFGEFFDVSVDFLLTGNNPKEKAPDIGGLKSDPLLAFYGDVKEHLSQDDLDDIMTIMDVKARRNKDKKNDKDGKKNS